MLPLLLFAEFCLTLSMFYCLFTEFSVRNLNSFFDPADPFILCLVDSDLTSVGRSGVTGASLFYSNGFGGFLDCYPMLFSVLMVFLD